MDEKCEDNSAFPIDFYSVPETIDFLFFFPSAMSSAAPCDFSFVSFQSVMRMNPRANSLFTQIHFFRRCCVMPKEKHQIQRAIRRRWKLRSSVSSMKNGITSCSRIVLMGKGKGVEEKWEIKEKIETFFLFLVVVSFYCSSLCCEAQNFFSPEGGSDENI